MSTAPNNAIGHEDWELRLQDWLDGSVDPAEARAVEAHLGQCEACAKAAAALRELDAELSFITSTASLDVSFDQALMARIDAEERERARSREQLLAESPALVRERLHRSLRRHLLAVGAAIMSAIFVLGWLLLASPFAVSPASLALQIASLSPLHWLAIGTALAGGSVAAVRTLHN